MMVESRLREIGLEVLEVKLGSAKVKRDGSLPSFDTISSELKPLNFELVNNQQEQLIEDVKHALLRLLDHPIDEDLSLSDYLSEQIAKNYSQVSKTFSRQEGLTIEKFFIKLKIEKATEMGAAEIHPVITDRTQTKTVRTDRLVSLSVEAAEQTERMDVPEISDAKTLRSAINNFNGHVFFCDEAGDNAQDVWGGESGRAPGFAEIGVSDAGKTRTGILVGPEGGFSPDEREWLRSLDFVTPITLGPRILRAETAVVAALTIWQALAGDWRQAPREN